LRELRSAAKADKEQKAKERAAAAAAAKAKAAAEAAYANAAAEAKAAAAKAAEVAEAAASTVQILPLSLAELAFAYLDPTFLAGLLDSGCTGVEIANPSTPRQALRFSGTGAATAAGLQVAKQRLTSPLAPGPLTEARDDGLVWRLSAAAAGKRVVQALKALADLDFDT
jgi:hypothetical protein